LINSLLSLLLHHLVHPQLLHLLLDFYLVFLLQGQDLIGSLFCLLNLFPCTHFLLLKESDTVGKELSVPLDTK
jgi:hypothetical protein